MIVSQTPLRISFTGGGTDIESFSDDYGGAVVSTTIDKYIYVVVKKRFDKKIRVAYTQTEIVDSIDEIKHDLVREALKLTGIKSGVEIVTLADIPSEGTGLGSSSTLTVGLLNALYSFQGYNVGAQQLAEEACEIEINILKNPIGKQDQYIAAFGGLRYTRFNPGGSVFTERVILSDEYYRKMESNIMLFYTGITRSASKILKQQKDNTANKMQQLVNLKNQSIDFITFLRDGEVDSLGVLLNQGWVLKKQLAEGISNPEIDDIYNKAIEAGALGGKIAGAGGGGFLMLYAPLSVQDKLREALPLQQMPIRFSHYGSRIIFNIE